MKTRTLGKIAAEALGYHKYPQIDMWDWYVPAAGHGIRPNKEQVMPSIQTGSESVTIADLDYAVTFYLYFSRQGGMVFNGVNVKGWSQNWNNLWTALNAWQENSSPIGQKLKQEWIAKHRWLEENPGYKRTLVPKAAQKNVYASQTDL